MSRADPNRNTSSKQIWVRLFENLEFVGVTSVDVVADGRITISRITDLVKQRCQDLLQNASSIRMYSGHDEDVFLPGSLLWYSRTHGGNKKETGLVVQFTTPLLQNPGGNNGTQVRLQRILHQMDLQHVQMLEVQQLLQDFRAETQDQWDQLLQTQEAMFQNTQTQLALILERQEQIMQIQPQMQEQMDTLKKETQEQIAELRQLCIIQLTRH